MHEPSTVATSALALCFVPHQPGGISQGPSGARDALLKAPGWHSGSPEQHHTEYQANEHAVDRGHELARQRIPGSRHGGCDQAQGKERVGLAHGQPGGQMCNSVTATLKDLAPA